MTKEENLALRERLKDFGLIITTYTGSGSQWAASMKNPDPNECITITIVDCSYGGEDFMKYRIKMDDDKNFNKHEFFVGKRISECSVKEVIDSVNKIDLMYKEWQIEKKLARMKDDF